MLAIRCYARFTASGVPYRGRGVWRRDPRVHCCGWVAPVLSHRWCKQAVIQPSVSATAIRTGASGVQASAKAPPTFSSWVCCSHDDDDEKYVVINIVVVDLVF